MNKRAGHFVHGPRVPPEIGEMYQITIQAGVSVSKKIMRHSHFEKKHYTKNIYNNHDNELTIFFRGTVLHLYSGWSHKKTNVYVAFT